MPARLSRRHRLILRWTLLGLALLAAGTSLFFALRPDPPDYRPGSKVEGITESLTRHLPEDYPRVRFRDVAAEAGMEFVHFWKSRSTQLPEDMGSGLAWADYDNDGDFDLFVVNFAGPLTLTPEERAASPARCRLFENRGDGTFEDVTERAGVGLRGAGMAAAWGDYDGDGWLDLAVTTYGPLFLFRNRGDGTFEDVTSRVGLVGFEGFWAGATWCDLDRDGDLDLYVCGYVKYRFDAADLNRSTRQYEAVVPFTLNPSSYEPERNLFFRNDGGRFRETAESLGLANTRGRSLTAACCDFDEDGWPELYVANDVSDNVLYRRTDRGDYEDFSHEAWVADYRGAMGLAVGDWDGDTDLDIFITHWLAQENALFDNTLRMPNLGQGENRELHFFDIADQVGLGQIALSYIGWGCSFFDYDNDGLGDLLVINGSTFQDEQDPTRLIPMKPLLFWNRGPEEGFYEVGVAAGDFFQRPIVGRGMAVADYDDDGDLDAAVLAFGERLALLRNEPERPANWLSVRVQGFRSNGLGARVELEAGGRRSVQVIGAQPSYLSQNAQEAHFGLGEIRTVERVRIVFPDGVSREWRDVPANQILRVGPEGGRAER
ncbi:MAG: CRTAC1 family protein [Acidobacteriota bacterium]